ncbi:hypothetical protein LY78DRAFT_259727 [Colletotrichum sublineola]|nr:hypothetical protein LY78DRAFT_259727 [Colletotrichum sublineola]
MQQSPLLASLADLIARPPTFRNSPTVSVLLPSFMGSPRSYRLWFVCSPLLTGPASVRACNQCACLYPLHSPLSFQILTASSAEQPRQFHFAYLLCTRSSLLSQHRTLKLADLCTNTHTQYFPVRHYRRRRHQRVRGRQSTSLTPTGQPWPCKRHVKGTFPHFSVDKPWLPCLVATLILLMVNDVDVAAPLTPMVSPFPGS